MSSYDMDRVRAWAAGELSEEQCREFEAARARDPELAALAAAWVEALPFTGIALEDTHAAARSSLSVEALDRLLDQEPAREPRPRTPWWKVAAALLLLMGAGAALLRWNRNTQAPPLAVVLHAIPSLVHASPMDPAQDAWLEQLSSYAPLRADGIAWLDSIEEAQHVAQATGQPLLLWCIHPTCPFCKQMRESTLLDPQVQALVANFVPVQLDVMQELRYAGLDPTDKGFPMFEVVNGELEALHTFFNFREPRSFMDELRVGLEAHGDHPGLRPERLPEVLEVLQAARAAERRGHLGRALAGYQAMGELGAGLALSELGESGVQRLAGRAHDFLEQARRHADPARVLSGAAGVFEGSDYAADFRALESETRRTGRFPALVWTP